MVNPGYEGVYVFDNDFPALSPPRVRPRLPSLARPTRLSMLIFEAKAAGLRARRLAVDAIGGPSKLAWALPDGFTAPAARSVTPLWSDRTLAEHAFQLGKVQNLRVACRALDGLVVPAGAVFSFWRQVGPPVPARGFVPGRMLQQGCMVGAVGGGLCQLSNALYAVALEAGCGIVERHAHSRIVPGSAAALGQDATVAWNYVDLRFRATRELRLTARLDRDNLSVGLHARIGGEAAVPTLAPLAASATIVAQSCGSCDETDCHLHERGGRVAVRGRRVFLADEAWPEFQTYVREMRGSGDRLGAPFDGARLGLTRYAWAGDGFDRVLHAPVATVRRALDQRSAGASAPARRAAETLRSRVDPLTAGSAARA